MIDLNPLGPSGGEARAVNSTGQVVGWINPGMRAFSWTEAGGLVSLGTLGSTSVATRVNDAGQVVGYSTTPSGSTHAFSWTEAGGLVDLGTLGGDTSSASAVSDAGEVVGYGTTASGEYHAFVWTAAAGMIDLGTLGGTSSAAVAVNGHGQIVGSARTANGDMHAVRWQRDTTPPVAPSRPDLAAASDSGTSDSDDVTSSIPRTFSGTAESGSTVTLFRDGAETGTALAAEGTWTIVDSATTNGTAVYTARSADPAGNVSDFSAGLPVTIDTVPPVLNLSGAPDGTEYVLPDVPPSPTFAPSDGSGSGIVSHSETWATPVGTSVGLYTYSAVAQDLAGNTTSETRSYRVVEQTVPPAPSTPDLSAAHDSGFSPSDDVTNSATLELSGTAETGSVVTLYRETSAIGTVTADSATGAWALSDSPAADGVYSYTATATNAAAIVSEHSGALVVIVDRTAPVSPSTPDLATASDSGASASDNLTVLRTLTLTGAAEAGAAVTVLRDETELGTAPAVGGVWSIVDSVPGVGSYGYTATTTDRAGNTSPPSAPLTVTVADEPGSPVAVHVTAGDGGVLVGFAPPHWNGGVPITLYTVTASPGAQTASSTASPIWLGGLANGTSYTFTVTASNPVGTSPASQPSAAVVPTAAAETGRTPPPEPSPATLPRPPAPDVSASGTPPPRPPVPTR
jgi:probable HAF family extracellular repeat protein